MANPPRADAVPRDQGVYELDPNVLASLQQGERGRLLEHKLVPYMGNRPSWSRWAKTFRLDVCYANGEKSSYFMKVSTNEDGKNALKGEYESALAIHNSVATLCPEPFGWGTYKSDPNSHFYISKFYAFTGDIPGPGILWEGLAELHSKSKSPKGKFGFHCATYNGDLRQENAWSDTWEEFYTNKLRDVLKIRLKRDMCNKYNQKLKDLERPLLDKVVPRLLRPLENEGRTIKPSLLHGDLWWGNTGVVVSEDKKRCLIFDAACFWGHHEYDQGNWRPKRNRFGEKYLGADQSRIPPSEPIADCDDRNALYSVTFNLHAAALFPGGKHELEEKDYLSLAIDEIQRLVDKYPEGYTDKAQ